jgi:hypothetical protein
LAHFHFHICDEHGAVQEGGDFPSIGDALKQAQRLAVKRMAQGYSSRRPEQKHIEITNAAGDVVSVAGLRDALR